MSACLSEVSCFLTSASMLLPADLLVVRSLRTSFRFRRTILRARVNVRSFLLGSGWLTLFSRCFSGHRTFRNVKSFKGILPSLSENLSYKVRESVRRTCGSLCPRTTPPCRSLYVVRSNRRFSDRIFRRSTNSQSAQHVPLFPFERTAVVAVFVNEARSNGSSRETK